MSTVHPKYSTKVMIEAIRETQGLVSLAARRLRCHPDTVRNYARRHPTVAAALAQARNHMTDIAELALFNAIQEKQGWAVCFYLKTQGRDRGYVERREVSGPEGGPIDIAFIDYRQILDDRIAAIAERRSQAGSAGELQPRGGDSAPL